MVCREIQARGEAVVDDRQIADVSTVIFATAASR